MSDASRRCLKNSLLALYTVLSLPLPFPSPIPSRFIAIWWPLKQMTKRRARIMIIGIWVIALVTTIPWLLFFDLVPAEEVFSNALVSTYTQPQYLCQEVWPPGTDGNLYFLLANLVACYLLPMSLITLCYVLIWIKVSTRSIPGEMSKDAQMDRMQQKSKVKVIKMLVAVVILFVLSWLPLYVIFARIKFGSDISQEEFEILKKVMPVAQWLGSSNSCINPILYSVNKKYRRGFAAIIQSRSCCGRLRWVSPPVRHYLVSILFSMSLLADTTTTWPLPRPPPAHASPPIITAARARVPAARDCARPTPSRTSTSTTRCGATI